VYNMLSSLRLAYKTLLRGICVPLSLLGENRSVEWTSKDVNIVARM
jgi:hypothetical protein